MRVIITGGSGLIGTLLARSLIADGHEVIVLTRSPEKVTSLPAGAKAVKYDARTAEGWAGYADGADAIVNLAGESIAGYSFFPKRWTDESKRRIRESRLNAGKAVTEAVKAAKIKPRVVVQTSAIGYYGVTGDKILTEDDPPGGDFLAAICPAWEASTQEVEALGVRRPVFRGGIPFTTKGGALTRLLLPFKLFAGGWMGHGRQYLSWIHIDDYVAAIRFLIQNEKATGVYNLTAPNPITSRQFARIAGKVMKRPWFFPVPGFVLRLLFGEVSTVVLDGQRALPERLLKDGFAFQYPEPEAALRDILKHGK
jgi:hypothetical protein